MVPMTKNTDTLPRNDPIRAPRATARNVIAFKRKIGVDANLRVGESPAFATLIQKDHPQKIVLLRVVYE
jgi:hypothetical protein